MRASVGRGWGSTAVGTRVPSGCGAGTLLLIFGQPGGIFLLSSTARASNIRTWRHFIPDFGQGFTPLLGENCS